jgi:hypothetical protein
LSPFLCLLSFISLPSHYFPRLPSSHPILLSSHSFLHRPFFLHLPFLHVLSVHSFRPSILPSVTYLPSFLPSSCLTCLRSFLRSVPSFPE